MVPREELRPIFSRAGEPCAKVRVVDQPPNGCGERVRVSRLDEDAIAFAANMTAALNQSSVEGGGDNAVHEPQAARNGVFAAMMARALAPTGAKADEFSIDWKGFAPDTGLAPGGKLALPVKLTRADVASPVRLTLLTSQAPVLVNNQPDPNRAIRVEKPTEGLHGVDEFVDHLEEHARCRLDRGGASHDLAHEVGDELPRAVVALVRDAGTEALALEGDVASLATTQRLAGDVVGIGEVHHGGAIGVDGHGRDDDVHRAVRHPLHHRRLLLPGAEPRQILHPHGVPREPAGERLVMLFGQEGPGLSEPAIEASDVVLEITQFGSTRSMNASAAAAVAMHAWVMQHVNFGNRG